MPLFQLKPLSTLPNSNQCFRVDVLANIQRNPFSQTNPLINILLSPLHTKINDKNSFDPSVVNSSQQETYHISAGEFYLYSPGSVIQKGNIIWTPQTPTIIQTLEISPEKIRFISAGEKIMMDGKSKLLIPPHIYKFGRLTNSPLLAIESEGDPYATLIPTMELLRHYHSGSSKLNRDIFSLKLIENLNDVINVKKSFFNKVDRELTLYLRAGYTDNDAEIIGRWFSDDIAYKQVIQVWNSVVRFHQDSRLQYIPLHISFPFIGTTQIKGEGIELPTPAKFKKKRKLILNLFECSYPRPFDKLVLIRDNKHYLNVKNAPDEGQTQIRKNTPRAIMGEIELDGKNDPFLSPSIKQTTKFIEIPSNRFPPIKLEKEAHGELLPLRLIRIEGSRPNKLPHQSTSEPKNEKSNAAPISLAPTEKEKNEDSNTNEAPAEEFKKFREMLDKLEKNHGIESIEDVVVFPGDQKSTKLISHFPTKMDHRKLKWSLIANENENGKITYRSRQAVLVKVKSEFGCHYLLEIERKKISKEDKPNSEVQQKFATYIFSKKNCAEVSPSEIEVLFTYLAKANFKNYKKYFKSYGFLISASNHSGNIESQVLLILEKMKDHWAIAGGSSS